MNGTRGIWNFWDAFQITIGWPFASQSSSAACTQADRETCWQEDEAGWWLFSVLLILHCPIQKAGVRCCCFSGHAKMLGLHDLLNSWQVKKSPHAGKSDSGSAKDLSLIQRKLTLLILSFPFLPCHRCWHFLAFPDMEWYVPLATNH